MYPMKNKKNSITIRKTKLKDIDLLYNLLNNLSDISKQFFHPHPFDKQTITDICNSKKDHYFVMLLKNILIGYSFLRLFNHEVPSFGCCIDSTYENKGYGKYLTIWTLKTAKELGYSKVILKVYKQNKIALDMYTKIGFIPFDTSIDNKEIIMEYYL